MGLKEEYERTMRSLAKIALGLIKVDRDFGDLYSSSSSEADFKIGMDYVEGVEISLLRRQKKLLRWKNHLEKSTFKRAAKESLSCMPSDLVNIVKEYYFEL